MKKSITPKKVATVVGAYFIAWIFVYPYINMFLTSVKTHDEIYATPTTHIPKIWQWSNYINVWKAAPIWAYLKTSLIVAIAATILVLIVSIPAAYFVSRYRFRFRGPFLLLVLA
ncbi:MAG: carbohydrate ABC transporter permease, partial [Actinobacteria bacterium]|nr:carbohydrate ABC transporter permease [Actinomycetota bacterium]